jgi:phenylacetate-CoA ligase
MFHHAGTNIYPSQIQNLLHHEDAFSLEFQLVVPPQGSGRHLKIRVEPAAEDLSADQLETSRAHLIEAVKYAVHVTPDVEVVEINSLPRFEGKGKRLIREDK